jgi:poly(3-hydroxybutyrate) depolymerase
VPIDGATNTNGTAFPSQQDDVDAMLDAQGCTGDPVETTDGATTCRTWTSCDAPVRSCTIADWPHAWPGEERGADGFAAEPEAEALFELATPHRD